MKKFLIGMLICVMIITSACTVRSEEYTLSEVPVTLNIVTTFAGADSNAQNFQSIIAEWEKKTGNVVIDGSTTADELFKVRIVTDFEVGSEPDVLFYFVGADANSFVDAGKVVSIEEIREEFPMYAANMDDEKLQIAASPVDGNVYAIPVNGYWEGLFVNKRILQEVGVKVPDASTTWEEFLVMCEAVKMAGYIPIATGVDIPHYWFEYCIYNQLSPENYHILPGSVEDTQGQAWVAGIESLKELYDNGYFPENYLGLTHEEAKQAFIEGKAAFYCAGSWDLQAIEQRAAIPENYTITYIPGNGARKPTDIIGGMSMGYYITRRAWEDPDKREKVVSLVMELTSDQIISQFTDSTATALTEGICLDEEETTSLLQSAVAFYNGVTSVEGAVTDQLPYELRISIVGKMGNILTGKIEIEDVVKQSIYG